MESRSSIPHSPAIALPTSILSALLNSSGSDCRCHYVSPLRGPARARTTDLSIVATCENALAGDRNFANARDLTQAGETAGKNDDGDSGDSGFCVRRFDSFSSSVSRVS
jgi:hypothetical protein